MRILLILVFLVSVLSVSAVDFHVFVSPEANNFTIGSAALFDVELRSNLPREQEFDVYSPEVNWEISFNDSLVVPVKGTIERQMLLRPINVNPGVYTVPVVFRPIGGSGIVRKILRINAREPLSPEKAYVPTVRGRVHMDPSVDPREPVRVVVELENMNKRPLDVVEVKVRSATVNGDFTTSLQPDEQKSETFTVSIDSKTRPTRDMLQVYVLVPGEKEYRFDLLPTPFKVMQYGDVEEQIVEDRSFLKKTVALSLQNTGNDDLKDTIEYPAMRWFASPSLPADYADGKFVWDVELAPEEMMEIQVMFDYRPVFFVLLVAFLAVVGYMYFRSPIVVRKRAKIVGTHGELSEMKIVIELYHRGWRSARKVKVMDLLPHVASYVADKTHMLEPVKVAPHAQQGTVLKWEIEHMEPREHRLIAYKAKTKYAIVGSLTLPVAAVRFLVDHKQRKAVSNRAAVTE